MFRSEVEQIFYQVNKYHVDWATREAMLAFSNYRLAVAERDDDAEYIRQLAYEADDDHASLAIALAGAEACADGLSVVGPNITYETLDRILQVRLAWRDWYEYESGLVPRPVDDDWGYENDYRGYEDD